MMGMGGSRHEVARLLQVSEGTVQTYLKAYATCELEALRLFNPHRQTAAFDTHATILREAFTAYPPTRCKKPVDRSEILNRMA